MSSFWSGWVIILTSITLALTVFILWANRKDSSGSETTGHVYDGIEEYNNPLPAWWLWMFNLSIIFAIGYLIAYPGMGNFKGLLNWSQINQYEQEVQRAAKKYEPLFEQYAQTPIPELANNKKAMRMGQRIFANNCAQCHGSDARGSFGFPNLTDSDWLYGGEPKQIITSITHGRKGMMMAWGSILNDKQVDDVVKHLLSLSGQSEVTAEGQTVYQTYCLACHGADATGNQILGGPNLTDNIWLYSGDPAQIKQTIVNGRNGNMPNHGSLLSKNRIHLLGAYVYGLSNAQ